MQRSSSSSSSNSESDELARAIVSAVRERKALSLIEELLSEAARKSVDLCQIRDCPEKGNTLLHLVLSKKCSKGRSFALQEENVKNILECLLVNGCCHAINIANRKCAANSGGCDSPLTIAADDGLLSVCELLLANRADVNFSVLNDVPDGHQFTPLLYAAKNASHNSGRDQSALCRLLLQRGADPNVRDAKGFVPLMWTAPEITNPTGQLEFARELLNFGAAVDATDNDGLTALWWTCHFCEEYYRKNPGAWPPCTSFILLLVARGANADLAVAAESVASPRQMLTRCNLQQMLEPEIVTISDDSDHSDFFPGRAVGGNSVRLPFKRLADDSSDQDPDDVAVGSLLGKRFARVKTAGPNCAPRRESVSAQHGSSAEADVADDEMATATMSMGITPSVEGRGFASPDAALHLDKKIY